MASKLLGRSFRPMKSSGSATDWRVKIQLTFNANAVLRAPCHRHSLSLLSFCSPLSLSPHADNLTPELDGRVEAEGEALLFQMSERTSEPFIFIVAGVKLFQRGHLRGLFISHRTADTAAVRVRSQTMLERGGAARCSISWRITKTIKF